MLFYYGTNLSEYGHYYYDLSSTAWFKSLWPSEREFPFKPDDIVSNNAPKGFAVYTQVEGYSIYAIAGSCKDERGGTKSVFWTKGDLTPKELKQLILDTPIAKKVIDQMKFTVMW